MSELSVEDKSKLATRLIEQTPPGEINDVVNDIRSIIEDDNALMPHVIPALRDYNLAQLQVVDHQLSESTPAHSSLLSSAAILPGSEAGNERYVDAEGKRSFAFDHVTLTASDYQPYELPEEEETFRAELAKSLAAYTKNHFQSGFSSVTTSQFPLLPPTPPAPAPPLTTTTEPTATEDDPPAEPIITDVIEEKVGTGEVEPSPTPAVDDVVAKKEEVDEEGGLEKVDELVEEAKEEEEREEAGAEIEKEGRPVVEEDTLVAGKEVPVEEPTDVTTNDEVEPEKAVEEVAPAVQVEERKQERVENPIYTLEIVGNKYNPNNFWTGRWRTRWIVDKSAGTVSGDIKVDVHYYEQGNVQLATRHTSSFPVPTESVESQSIASQIVTTISKIETNYHLELNDVYGELGDKAFRALRRALPVTRQKMDWEKVSGYSLGSDLTKARA